MIVNRPTAGMQLNDLETPCLVVDLDALDNNYNFIGDIYKDTSCKMRQHAKNVKSPILLQRQFDAGGTNNGVCVAKVSEAEVMLEGGIKDILITSEIVGEGKVDRLAHLAELGNIKVCVDNAENLRSLSRAAKNASTVIGVLIEVDTSMRRAGVRSPEEGVALAKLAISLPGITFMGIMSHQSITGYPDRETRFTEGTRYIKKCLRVKHAIEREGIDVDIVSSGETFTIDVAVDIPEVTEVEGGTYALMGFNELYMDHFRVAVKVLTSVIEVDDSFAYIDAGIRCLGAPLGRTPRVENRANMKFEKMFDYGSILTFEGDRILEIGDKLLLESSQQDVLVNRWDHFIAIRDGVVRAVWDIAARGCHH